MASFCKVLLQNNKFLRVSLLSSNNPHHHHRLGSILLRSIHHDKPPIPKGPIEHNGVGPASTEDSGSSGSRDAAIRSSNKTGGGAAGEAAAINTTVADATSANPTPVLAK